TMRDTLNALAHQCDWVLPGVEEGRILTGHSQPERIAAYYRERGAKLVVIKLGPAGAFFDSDAGSGHVAAFPVERVIDTVGAGDGARPDRLQRQAWCGRPGRCTEPGSDLQHFSRRRQLRPS